MQQVTTAYVVPVKEDVSLDMFILGDELHFGVDDLRKGYHKYHRRDLQSIGELLQELVTKCFVPVRFSEHITLNLFWDDNELKFHYRDNEANYKLNGKII